MIKSRSSIGDDHDQVQAAHHRMKQWILEEPGSIAWVESPNPHLEPGDLLVRVLAATTCGTDLKAYLRGHPQIPMPGPFGHEWCGVIEEAEAGSQFQIGSRVYGVHTAPCLHCFWCKRGQENLCETIMQTKVMGSFATNLHIPKRIADHHVFPLPAHLQPEVACLVEPLACVMEAILQMNPKAVDRIAVIGPGAIGLLFCGALSAQGIEEVTLFGRSPDRLSVALEMGINAKPSDHIDAESYDFVIECTGSKDIWESAPGYVRKGGTVVLFGGLPGGTKVEFDSGRIHYSQIKVMSPFHFGSEAVRNARRMIEASPERFAPLITDRVRLADLPKVLHKLANREGVKYALIP